MQIGDVKTTEDRKKSVISTVEGKKRKISRQATDETTAEG